MIAEKILDYCLRHCRLIIAAEDGPITYRQAGEVRDKMIKDIGSMIAHDHRQVVEELLESLKEEEYQIYRLCIAKNKNISVCWDMPSCLATRDKLRQTIEQAKLHLTESGCICMIENQPCKTCKNAKAILVARELITGLRGMAEGFKCMGWNSAYASVMEAARKAEVQLPESK